jgi:hypothetical protein
MGNKSFSDNYIDLAGLSADEQKEFKRISDPVILRGLGEFDKGELDDRWIELYLKAAKARIGIT